MADRTPTGDIIDLTACDREPIHVPGAVQPHGVLLSINPQTFVVVQAAGDAPGLFGRPVGDLINIRLADLLAPSAFNLVHGAVATHDLVRPLHLVDLTLDDGIRRDASVHRAPGGYVVIEFEALAPHRPFAADPLAAVRTMVDRIAQEFTVADLCRVATEEVRRTSGYDRVMVYRFLPDDSGCVVAESTVFGLEPFLGLHYPASDIPAQARALFLENWLRIIADVDAPAAPLVPPLDPATGAPLDMRQSTLRAVSPIHLQYLRNMGVAATMTISVVRGGRLWGLIACHHRTPRHVPRHLRSVCDLFGQMFSLRLDACEHAAALAFRARHEAVHAGLVAAMSRSDGLFEGLAGARSDLLSFMDADGVALVVEGRFAAVGRVPTEEQVRGLAAWLDTNAPDGLFVTDALSSVYPPGVDFATDAAGVVVIGASRTPADRIFWFRPEVVETVRWGGNPEKSVVASPDGDRLMPRASFAEWRESVRLRSRAWSDDDVASARGLRLSLLEVVLRRMDQIAREREAAGQRHAVMLAELNHRVKNTLTTIRAIAHFTRTSAASLEDYLEGFERRIHAMAASHDLLTVAFWQSIAVRSLVEAQLLPYASGANIDIDGPDVQLTAATVPQIGIVLHELATNAVKYGALSGTGGRVTVRWAVDPAAPELRIIWTESGGPTVVPPVRRGFGTFTLENIIGFEIAGRTTRRFDADGLHCEIMLREGFDAVPAATPTQASPPLRAGRERPCVLVVEDEALVAYLLETTIEDHGWACIGPVARVGSALALADDRTITIDAAVLDVNVAGEAVWPVADALAARGVPMLFSTGYDRSGLIPDRFAGAPVLGKPFQIETFAKILGALIDRA
jgi:two-component system, chemotaxis family, sensor kinase Cph1